MGEVTQDVVGTTLVGSLLLADGASSPLLVIASGSGPTDRDGNTIGPAGAKTDNLKLLAAALAKNGVSSLRFDKRLLPSAKPPTGEHDLRFPMLADDIAAWVNRYVRESRFERVIVAGHSEGATLGALAAQRSEASAYISISGPARRAGEVLRHQLSGKLPKDLEGVNEKILTELESGQFVTEVPSALVALYRPSVQPYLMSWLSIDPIEEISKLKVPIAIVQGDTDVQVPVDDAIALRKASQDSSLCIIAGMNHVLKDAPSEDTTSYFNPKYPINEKLVDFISDFATRELPTWGRRI